MIRKSLTCVLIMVTIAPLLVVLSIAFTHPEASGGYPYPQGIFLMYIMGFLIAPLWITYIPSVILAPFLLNRLSKIEVFRRISFINLLALSILFGAIIGIVIMIPILLPMHSGSGNAIYLWVLSGAISGSITLTIIVMIYRFGNYSLYAKR